MNEQNKNKENIPPRKDLIIEHIIETENHFFIFTSNLYDKFVTDLFEILAGDLTPYITKHVSPIFFNPETGEVNIPALVFYYSDDNFPQDLLKDKKSSFWKAVNDVKEVFEITFQDIKKLGSNISEIIENLNKETT